MGILTTIARQVLENAERFEQEFAEPPHLWATSPFHDLDDVNALPSLRASRLMEQMRLDCRAIDAIVTPARQKVLDTAMLQMTASALNTAAALGVADAIDEEGGRVALSSLSRKLQVNENKLGRILRLLAGHFYFREIEDGVFANSRHSLSLKKAGDAEYFISLAAEEAAMCGTGLREDVSDFETTDNVKPNRAPFSKTVSTKGESIFDYVATPAGAKTLHKMIMGITPWLNHITRPALLHDFPWEKLDAVQVIDVGCGPGDVGLDVLKLNASLKWCFQDKAQVLEQTKESVVRALPPGITASQVSFEVQDYLEPNRSDGDVWFLRGVVREHDDQEAIRLLSNIAEAMARTPGSRMLINEICCGSATVILDEDEDAAPSTKISEQQSMWSQLGNTMCWNTYVLLGGKERSFQEIKMLVHAAGLEVTRFYQMRSFIAGIDMLQTMTMAADDAMQFLVPARWFGRGPSRNMKVAVLYQALPPPEIDGIKKPPKPGGYQDSGADIAFSLNNSGDVEIVTPTATPQSTKHEGWAFPDTENGIHTAVDAGSTVLWANTILFRQHPLQVSKKLDEYAHDLSVVGQPPSLVEAYDDKYLVNAFLRSQECFTLPTFCTTTSADSAHLFDSMRAARLEFPIVAKPIRGRGSHGVKVCRSMDTLVSHASEILAESPRILLEQFLSGTEGTITVMPPTSERPEYWAMPVVVRFNHMEDIAPYNGVVAVAANSKVPTAEEIQDDPALARVSRECEKVAELLQFKAPIRIDIRRLSKVPRAPFALFDVNAKPNMTVPGRPGRDDQASLLAIAATALGWDSTRLLLEILKTATPLSALRKIDLPPSFSFVGAAEVASGS
ncbi:O-methyltransferase domain-containing protein 5 [Elsinoe fawcettii]|nr:O-methyltransferase domain-containing protein 5 [Elsinoe fawcettii]